MCAATIRHTKIVATLGPATNTYDKISALALAGANVFRLNFSHGSYEEHAKLLEAVRKIEKDLGVHLAILQDLSGPKIRISSFQDGTIQLNDGEQIELRYSLGNQSDRRIIYVEGLDPSSLLQPGHSALLVDGTVELKAEEIGHGRALCSVIKGGRVPSRVGIAFPDSNIELPATTAKDLQDLRWGIKNGIDYAALSFVRDADDLGPVRSELTAQRSTAKLIAKIERRAALDNLDAIIEASDGVMVARGDLGLDLPMEQVPSAQKRIINRAAYYGKPVIVATQMLRSMLTAVRPTRAEVSDVATAVAGGADAVMLSEETAMGENPVACIQTLHLIALETEKDELAEHRNVNHLDEVDDNIPKAVALGACAAAAKLGAAAIIAITRSGASAWLAAKFRPRQPIIALSSEEATLRQTALVRGVQALEVGELSSNKDISAALKRLQLHGFLPSSGAVVILRGLGPQARAASMMEIRELSDL